MVREEPNVLFNPERLALGARVLAQHHRGQLTLGRKPMRNLRPLLDSHERTLLEAYRNLAIATRRGEEVLPAGEWILDNFYLIREQTQQIQKLLPRGYYRKLPRLKTGSYEGFPRVYQLVHELATYTDNVLNEEYLTLFLQSYQEEELLTLSELWAVPIMARLVLIQHLEKRANELLEERRVRQRAGTWAETITRAAKEDSDRGLRELGRMSEANPSFDMAFLGALARGLESADILSEPEQAWLDKHFQAAGTSMEEEARARARRQTRQQVSVGNAVMSLRRIADADWSTFVEALSAVEQILRLDPARVYSEMDAETRNRYRSRVEHLSEYADMSEFDIARKALSKAEEAVTNSESKLERHVGWYLTGDGDLSFEMVVGYGAPFSAKWHRFTYRHAPGFYLGTIAVLLLLAMALPFSLAWVLHGAAWMIGLVLLTSVLPALDVSISFTNWIVTHTLPPRVLPKMEFEDGIPEDFSTLVVVPTFVSSPSQAQEQVDRLEISYLANPDIHLRFALLTGFPDAPQQTMPGDEATLEVTVQGIRALNLRYSEDGEDRFFLLHRFRTWNPQEGVWMEWERKRGKLEELTRLLRDPDADTGFQTMEGRFRQAAIERSFQYVITLDADTRLPSDTARDLVRTAAHPFNRPCFDPAAGRVVKGYGILQPRISILPESALHTPFARLFSGNTGVDPYTTAVSDAYQDLFGEGIYTGKGLFHVDSFREALDGTLPDNTILSHDLLEGNYVRVALVTDIELFDEYPSSWPSWSRRLHRWIRGDWQILPWLFRTVPTSEGRRPNPLTWLGKWKIFDNLRRSVTPCALLVFLCLGWLIFPGSPLAWTLLGLFILAFPVFAGVAWSGVSQMQNSTWKRYSHAILSDFVHNVMRAALTLMFLPHQVIVSTDAIARSLWRVYVSHRNRLEWVTASQAESQHGMAKPNSFREMAAGSVVGAIAAGAVAFWRPTALSIVLPITVLWIVAPYIVRTTGRPRSRRRVEPDPDERMMLQRLAGRTWAFFDRYVGPSTRWLPPDNVQMEPWRGPALRTSPTNMGLALLSVQAAYDFGFLSLSELIDRLGEMIGSMRLLDTYRGHFYNWYGIKDGAVLSPRYVSTVDSGNLAACLLTLKQALFEVKAVVWPNPHFLEGLVAVVGIMREEVATHEGAFGVELVVQLVDQIDALEQSLPTREPASLADWWRFLSEIGPRAKALSETAALLPRVDTREDPRYWFDQPHVRTDATQKEFEMVFPSIVGDSEACVMALETIPSPVTCDALLRQADSAGDSSFEGVPVAVSQWMHHANRLATWCDEMAGGMEFGFLLDRGKNLFTIGFNEDRMALDEGTYDLFASEARVASFLAVARGDVSVSHWFRLSRRLVDVRKRRVLVSWGGTMFEYLMPLLFMRRYEATLLDETYDGVVYAQRRLDGRTHPWGISESAYYRLNMDLDYQYRAFGVPELGLKRGLAEDSVVAPYATMLALPVDLEHGMQNLKRLRKEGAFGSFGFYEAVDYTKSRMPEGYDHEVIFSFMAHHQGMSLLALVNVLFDNRVQELFHADPLVRSCELLLQERLPVTVPPSPTHSVELEHEPSEEHSVHYAVEHVPRERLNEDLPLVHLLSNGRFNTVLTASGTGYSTFKGMALTAWDGDRTRDAQGVFLYVRDRDRGTMWSMGHQPVQREADRYDSWFHVGKVEMARVDDWIETFMEVCVSLLEDIELRRYTITNYSNESRTLELTSYAEVVLNDPESHAAHPAFSKLFVETEYVSEHHALLAGRRRRRPEDPAPWLVHVLASKNLEELPEPLQYETNRAQFIGRGRSRAMPAALDPGVRLGGNVGSVLDPIVSFRYVIHLEPGEKTQVTFGLGAAASREDAHVLADKYDNPYAVDRAFNLARVYGLIQLQNLDVTQEQALEYSRLAGSLLYDNPAARAPEEVLKRNRRGQSALWRYGISGDVPLVVFRVSHRDSMSGVRSLLRAHTYWRHQGLVSDLLILNEHATSYADDLQDAIVQTVEATARHAGQTGSPHVFVRKVDEMPAEDLDLVRSVAHIVLEGDLPNAASFVRKRKEPGGEGRPVRLGQGRDPVDPAQPPDSPIPFDLPHPPNGYGTFNETGDEYVITLPVTPDGLRMPPLPWVNVIANEHFGSVVSESGAGSTWSGNSRENRLTPWSNDPILDPHEEAIYVKDEDTDLYWSPLPGPTPAAAAYEVRHGFGYSVVNHTSSGLEQEVLQFIPVSDPVKIVRVRLKNRTDGRRKLSLFRFQRWVMGVFPEKSSRFVNTEFDPEIGTLLATNPYNNEFAGRVAFAAAIAGESDIVAYTADRTAFLGRHGRMETPAALRSDAPLDATAGVALDPCAAFQVTLELEPGGVWTGAFLLGEASDRQMASELVTRYRKHNAESEALEEVRAFWRKTLSTIRVSTPSVGINRMMNGWLLYQNLACRLWARSGFYQSGGAFGFRDQLQDAAAMLYTRPDLTRNQILLHAAHQFLEGDVLHWWHPPTGRGIRTRISDDLLWLPYVTGVYLQVTGDEQILDENVPFIVARALEEGEDEAYLEPVVAGEEASLFEHCCRAIDRSLTKGSHGLPLMGSGDWNDGMNRVGNEGRGESVWLAFFLYGILDHFGNVCERRGDTERANAYRKHRKELKEAVERAGWDGEWYRRAYYDDGTPLGSAQNNECRIDALAQAWAVLSGMVPHDRAVQAMLSVEKYLVFEDEGLIRLLTPPFHETPRNPGYIKGYLPGVRENGGQYTHAAVWVVAAFARLGMGDRAGALLEMLCPSQHAQTKEEADIYQVEPYVVAADVYGVAPHIGRGGWTWYTGSAGWMYRTALESLLGFRVEKGTVLVLDPCIPSNWPKVDLVYRSPGDGTVWQIHVSNPSGVQFGIRTSELDGDTLDLDEGKVRVSLVRDGIPHRVDIVLGQASGR